MSFYKIIHKIEKENWKRKIVCKKIDAMEPDQLSGVYEIQFNNADGTLQYCVRWTIESLKRGWKNKSQSPNTTRELKL